MAYSSYFLFKAFLLTSRGRDFSILSQTSDRLKVKLYMMTILAGLSSSLFIRYDAGSLHGSTLGSLHTCYGCLAWGFC